MELLRGCVILVPKLARTAELGPNPGLSQGDRMFSAMLDLSPAQSPQEIGANQPPFIKGGYGRLRTLVTHYILVNADIANLISRPKGGRLPKGQSKQAPY